MAWWGTARHGEAWHGRYGVISVIVPTIPGREEHYERNVKAYWERTEAPHEIITEYDHPTVGQAWQAGADKARGDYIAFSCDDLEVMAGWDAAAMAMADSGAIPSPRVINAHTGALESRPAWGVEVPEGMDTGISVVPFCSRAQWEAIGPLCTIHYYSDDFFSWRARRAGWPSRQCNAYCFRHHWAQHRRGAGMTEGDRMTHDQQVYTQAMIMVGNGQWAGPWPDVPDPGKRKP